MTKEEAIRMLEANKPVIKVATMSARKYAEAYEMALSDFKNKGEWIPCSERLPEQFKEVIVTDIETCDTYLSRYVGNGYWECDNGLFKNRIIAWQPKPKPYKEEKGGECE